MSQEIVMAEAARNEVAQVEERQVVTDATSIIHLIERAVSDPNIDVDKMERLYAMHERALERAAKQAFTEAKLAMRPSLPTIAENGAILNAAGKEQSTYAEWEDINDAIQPILIEHGFDLAFRPGGTQEGKVTVTGILRHSAGHQEEAEIILPLDASGGKNAVQGVGSSLSYGKRYAAIALLNITSRHKRDRDDDGKGAGLSEVTQHAISDINVCDTLDDLRAWKNKNFDGFSKMVQPHELKEVVALYNRRSKAFRAATEQKPVNDFPGDR
jgi:hypothetical protein